MAQLDAITIAFDMDPVTNIIFEPEPTFTREIVSETSNSVTTLEETLDGRLFLLETNFALLSPTEVLITGFSILSLSSVPQAVANDINIVIDIEAPIEELIVSAQLSTILAGPDSFDGSDLDDVIFGFGGNDFAVGRGGADSIYGNQGDDAIYGNAGNDWLFGGQGFDVVFGGQNDDAVYGNLQADQIYGNFGNDDLFGGQGDDTLYGGQGDDVLVGNKGNDLHFGGASADRFVFAPGSGADVIADFQNGIDRIDVFGTSAGLTQQGADTLVTLGSGDTILVLNISEADLADDIFVM